MEFILHTLLNRVQYRSCSVQFYKLFRLAFWNIVEIITKSFHLFHLSCSVIMEDSADIELYEKIIGNPAYSSSSDTSKSDPVSVQFKEPRQTECREEEDNFPRARSRSDPSIISHAVAGKDSQEPRSCDTFVECGSSRKEFYDNSTILAPTSTFDTFARVAPDVEPTLRTSVLDTFTIPLPLHTRAYTSRLRGNII